MNVWVLESCHLVAFRRISPVSLQGAVLISENIVISYLLPAPV